MSQRVVIETLNWLQSRMNTYRHLIPHGHMYVARDIGLVGIGLTFAVPIHPLWYKQVILCDYYDHTSAIDC